MKISNILSLSDVCNIQDTGSRDEFSIVLRYPGSIVTDYFGVSDVRTIIGTSHIKYLGVNTEELYNEMIGESFKTMLAKYNFKCSADINIVDGRIVARSIMFYITNNIDISSNKMEFGTPIQCMCCFTDIESNVITRCTGKTSHAFCNECMKSHFNELVLNNKLDTKCISTDACNGKFLRSSLNQFMDSTLLRLYEKMEQRNEIRSAIAEQTIACPFCSIEVIDERPEHIRLFHCPNRDCLRLSCSECMKEYHGQSMCTTMQDKIRKDKEEEDTYNIIKSCPNCNIDIERTTGCNHMKCTCGITFCYLCGENITNRILTHSCPIYGTNSIALPKVRESSRIVRHVRVEPIYHSTRVQPELRHKPTRQPSSPPVSFKHESVNSIQGTPIDSLRNERIPQHSIPYHISSVNVIDLASHYPLTYSSHSRPSMSSSERQRYYTTSSPTSYSFI